MQHQDLFYQLADTSDTAYAVFNAQTQTFDYVNPACYRMLGFAQGDSLIPLDRLQDRIHPEDRRLVAERLKSLQTSGSEKLEFRLQDTNGSMQYINAQAFILPGTESHPVITVLADDVSVRQSNILYMEKVNAKKNAMLEILSHDLAGPMGMVNMVAEKLEQDIDTENEQAQRMVSFIKELCMRNITMIRGVINEEFKEAAEVTLRTERIDIVDKIGDIIATYRKSEDVILKKFEFLSSHDVIQIELDTLKMIQVVNNLISNAIKFTPDYGVIKVTILLTPGRLVISVADNGIGIPEHMQPYLFERYTRARRNGLKGEETTGLGMSIIKEIVTMHDGTIWFDSVENKGSTFYVQLPLHTTQ